MKWKSFPRPPGRRAFADEGICENKARTERVIEMAQDFDYGDLVDILLPGLDAPARGKIASIGRIDDTPIYGIALENSVMIEIWDGYRVGAEYVEVPATDVTRSSVRINDTVKIINGGHMFNNLIGSAYWQTSDGRWLINLEKDFEYHVNGVVSIRVAQVYVDPDNLEIVKPSRD